MDQSGVYDHGSHQGLTNRNNGLAGSYAQTRSNSERHLWGRNNAGAPLPPVDGNFTSDVGMVNGSFTQSGSSQAGYTEFEWDDLLNPDLTPVSFTSLLNGGDNLFQVPQYGTPACSRPLYNFNSPARRDAGGSVCESSCQTVPSTPSLCRTVQENGFLEKITTTGHEITEPKSDKSVQSIVDSSVVNSTKGSKSIEFDLNKTPQQKPSKRKKKFMPKVVVEGKPKRKPRKPATPENVKSKETGSGKRKRAQKTNLKESATKKPANVGDMCSPEVTLKSCRKALNFDLEKTGDARQGDSESVEKSCGSSSFSEIRDASGGTNGSFLDSVRNQPDKLSTGAKLPRVLEDHTRILARDKQPEQCQFPVATQNTQFPVGNQQAWLQMKNQLNGFPFGNQLSRMTTRNYLAMGNQKPMCLVGTPPPALASGNQQLGGLQGNKQPIFLNQQTCISAGNRQYESPTGMGFTHLNQMVAAYMSSPGLRPHSQSQIPATNQHVESVSRSFNETAGTCQRSSIPEYGSLRKHIHQENEYIPSHERSSAECLGVYKKALSQNSSPPTPVMAKLDEAKGSKRQYHRAMGQTQNDDLNLAGQWQFLQHIPQSQDVDRQIAKSQDLKRQNKRKKMKIQKVFQDNLHSMPPEVVDIEDDPTDGARKDKNTASVVETVSTGIPCLVQKSSDNENCIVPKTPARKGRAGRKKSVPPPANASEIQRCQPTLPKTPSTRSTAKKKGTKSMQDSEKTRGPSEEFLSHDLMVEIINTMHNLNLGEKSRNQEQNALVLYRGDGAVVPYESKKRKPRPKVDLDDETTRTWNLLMGKGDKNEDMDKKKEKWWEEERRVFRGRADSFIARMHLVQGDRRFSPWKGSVVDSVIGVFLTQNVTDHLSSSAFMSLAARFPPKSSSNQEDGRSIKSVIVEDPEGCILNLNDIPSLREKVQNPSDTQVSGVDSGQNLEEEILSSQDSFDPAIFQSCGRVGSCSCSKSDAEFSTTRCETKTVGGSAQSVQTGSPNLSDEIFLNGNERPLLYEGSGDVQIQETANVAQKKPDLEKTMNWKDSLSFGQPSNDTNWQNEGPTNASSSYEQSAVGQPQVVDIEDFGMQDEGLGYSWLSISQSVDRGKNKNAPRRFRRFFREGGRVPREFTGKIIPSTPHEIPGMGLSASSSTNQVHQGDVQHNQQCGTQQNEMNKAPHFFMDLLNSAEECLTRQCSTTDNIMDDLLLRDKTTKDVVDQLIKNTSLRNTLVESSSSKKEQTAVEYNETNPTVVREMKGTLADGKKPTSQWDSLRKDVEGNVGRKERSKDSMDSIDYEAIRRASISEISESIKERGMNNMLAVRIKDFLERIVKDHGGVDLEWLRDVPADKAKDYLLSIRGLGLKSVECVRLLTLHNLAFPVDTNVGRIAVRLGWVPLQPLPESLQLHLLELYPVLESIQKFLWPRLCKLDQRTLYELHYQLITFGKVFCTKSKPNCNACPMRGECRHFASAYASARLALPAPDERSLTSAIIPVSPESFPPAALPMMELPPPLEKSLLKGAPSNGGNCEPVIEEPASPEQECTEITESDIEDAYYNEDPDEIPTIKLNIEQFGMTLREHIERNMGLQDGDMSKALVALNPTTTYIPTPKLKNISRLRTEHQVYELPDSHPLLDGMDRRERDDPSPYLLAIWTPGETANSAQPPEQKCGGQASGKMCFDETCSECNSVREAKSQTVRGTLLIPCRTAMRGSFPLNGTYFQVNELFADHDSSLQPIAVPTDLIWHLPRRIVYFGTSVTSIFKGLTTEQIQHCFWKGFVCVRGFEQKTRAPRPLMARLHFPASRLKSNKT